MELFSLCLGPSFVVFFLYLFVSRLLNRSVTFPESIPVVGLRKQLFKNTRASFRQLTGGIKTLTDGYRQYSRYGRPFLIHDSSYQKELMLPPEHIEWFLTQSDSTLSKAEIRKERFAGNYLYFGVEIDPTVHFFNKVIRRNLTRKLDMIQGSMYDEIRRSIDDVLGVDDTEWKTLNLYRSIQEIILPVMGRVIFGPSLGRNLKFLNSFRRWVLAMNVGTIVIGQLPHVLKGLVAPIFNVPVLHYRRMTLKDLVPEVKRQLSERDNDQSRAGGDKFDFIKQCATLSAKIGGNQDAADPKILAERMALIGFSALFSTIIEASNVVLDIVSCPPEMRAYESLREETANSIKSDDDWNNVEIFKGLTLSDSAIRETLRYHPMFIKGLTKEVVRSEGLNLPDGTLIPQGGWIGVPVLGVHRDSRYYSNPQIYDPFRFAKMKQDRENPQEDGSTEKPAIIDDLDAGRPSPTYLGFGYGPQACPGRWFAVLMIKTLLAYMALNYDIESTGPPPELKAIGDALLPPISATIRVRRRKRTGTAGHAL